MFLSKKNYSFLLTHFFNKHFCCKTNKIAFIASNDEGQNFF